MDARYDELKKILDSSGLDALLITKRANQRYLEGFTGDECFLLASGRENFIIADSRYTEMAENECRTAHIRPHRSPFPPLGEVMAGIAAEMGWRRIGFEGDHIKWGLHEEISDVLTKAGVEFVPGDASTERLRAVKDDAEIRETEAACGIADRALEALLPMIRPGVSELDMVVELDYRLKKEGADDVSFDTIVLFGARSSQPHATPSRDAKLTAGDFVLIDYGAARNGYRSDTTRTFVCGRASDEQRRAYETLLRAQRECVAMIAPGANGRDVTERAITRITDAGFPAFSHGLGHGVGLEIHELPTLRQSADSILEPGMILTVEPGTYRPGWGGIRIEDTVLVTDEGHRVLTHFKKELIEL